MVEYIVRKKKKLLLPSNFSFSHNVFHSYISLVHQNAALCGNGFKKQQQQQQQHMETSSHLCETNFC